MVAHKSLSVVAGIFTAVFGAPALMYAQLPDWVVSPLGLSGVWERADFVVTGQMQNVHSIGAARADRLPPSASPTIKRIYWCEGQFYPESIVRGEMPVAGLHYRWGAITPGCKLDSEKGLSPTRPQTLVWFIRKEGAYLRPVVDGGGPFFFTLDHEWAPKGSSPERYFGEMLLSPDATGMTQEEFAQIFVKAGSLACVILGREDCIARIRGLAARADRPLRDAACSFLKRQLGEVCSP